MNFDMLLGFAAGAFVTAAIGLVLYAIGEW